MKKKASWRTPTLRRLGDRSVTSRFIGQPLATEAPQGFLGAGYVIDAQPFAVAVSEIKLGQIAVQMRLAHMEV